jgi:hypothetical protein
LALHEVSDMADAAGSGAPEQFPRTRWIDIADVPVAEGKELGDAEVPIVDERPVFKQGRDMEGGPYNVMPDGGEQVPTDFYAGIDLDAIGRAVAVANMQPPEVVTPEGKATIPEEQRTLLEQGSDAAKQLLVTIDRGPNATSEDLERAVHSRMRDAGLI